MPVYDFKCTKTKCGNVFEQIVPKYDSVEEPVVVSCTKCGSKAKTIILPTSRKNVKFLFNYMES